MNLQDILAVSGLPGLYKVVNTKSNGLLVADLDEGKTRFCSMRKHQFTPMETVAIYTDTDTEDLKTVFNTMLAQLPETEPVSVAAPSNEIKEYFATILPDYDRDRVHIGDMKKVIKWFNFLNERGYLNASDEEE